MTAWTTDGVKPSDRFSYWREVVCQKVNNIATEAPPEDFWARIAGRSFGALRLAAFESSSHEIVRGRQQMSRGSADDYVISLQRSGQCHIVQDDESFVLDPGEIGIVDAEKSYRVTFPHAVSRILAVVPKKALDQRLPWLGKTAHRKISGASPFIDLTRRHLEHLASSEHDLSEHEATVLSENVFNLLALALARDVPADTLRPDMQLTALLGHCRRHLGNPDLSPHMVAAHFGMSVRTLHLRFGQVGQTFGRWLLGQRLEACRAGLRDPNQRTACISEIAYRCGFNDLSHFNKVFRARFDQTPREWRNGG